MLNFGNFDLSYADSNTFWEFFWYFRCASLGMFLQEYFCQVWRLYYQQQQKYNLGFTPLPWQPNLFFIV